VGQGQCGAIDDQIPIKKEIEIEGARPPALMSGAAKLLLNPLEVLEQS